MFFGVEENGKIASELYGLWHKNIDEMAEKARWANVLELKKKYGHHPKFRHWIKVNKPEEDPQYFRASWIRGCLSAMHLKVYQERKAREDAKEASEASQEGKSDSSNAIVLYKAEVDKAYQAFSSVGFKKIKRGGSRGFSESGYQQGKATGEKIKIGSKQLES